MNEITGEALKNGGLNLISNIVHTRGQFSVSIDTVDYPS